MTLKKKDLSESVMQRVRLKKKRRSRQIFLFPEMDCIILSRRRSDHIVNSFFEILKTTLSRGEDIKIRGFGRFLVRFRWAREGRNPNTGERLFIRSSRGVAFRPSKRLKRLMNGD